MSRRKKNLRAFLHQNPNPTIEQAWDSAWEGAQKRYHAKRIAELEAKVERLEKDIQDAFLRNCRPDDGRGFAGSPSGYEV